MKNTTFVGNIGEDIAVNLLKKKGYRILERNVKICGTEIDIICEAKDKCRTIVFCEVKTRYDSAYGSAAEAVTPYKIGRYVRAAKAYLARLANVNKNLRFDVIEVGESGINHIENAFDEGDAKYPRKRF
ncbi:MAG: YraN family protein [Bacteroides sp.]|nr:YraN family protein [Bacillota bacterium]MCM1393709.1 YraN family protein [[Eubacterium] siraeum]MCM1456083.1 YraN family protein [Bacteroides sp.]